jgi:hypothetical protein
MLIARRDPFAKLAPAQPATAAFAACLVKNLFVAGDAAACGGYRLQIRHLRLNGKLTIAVQRLRIVGNGPITARRSAVDRADAH